MNVVMTGDGTFVEVQGTAEGAPFDRAELDALLDPGREGLRRPDPAAARGARRDEPAGLPRLAQRQEARRDAADPRRARARRRGARPRRRARRTTSRSRTEPTFEGNALLKARAGARGDRAAVARRRQRAVRRRAQRDAGRAVGALVRAAQGRRRATTSCCSTSSPTCPTSGAARTSRCAVAFVPARRRASTSSSGEMPGRVIREMRGSGGFGYDVLFVADERPTTAPPPSCRRRRRTRSPTAAGRCARSRPSSPTCSGLTRRRPTVRRRRTRTSRASDAECAR